jgi:hypothetical protein
MASPTYTVGDTVPAFRGAASDENGLMNLSSADEVKLIAVPLSGGEAIEGAVQVLNPPEDVGDPSSAAGFNWRYILDADDTATTGSWQPWLKITWDSTSTPPEIEFVKSGDQIIIQAAP